MALSDDQKKHLLIGGGLGALVLAAGYLLIGKRHALPAGREDYDEHRHPHHREGHSDQSARGDRDHENDRGEYGRKKHRHHGEHEHGG